MDELTPRARTVLDAARGAFEPPGDQQARLWARLQQASPNEAVSDEAVSDEASDAGPEGGSPDLSAATPSAAANWGLYLVIVGIVVGIGLAWQGLGSGSEHGDPGSAATVQRGVDHPESREPVESGEVDARGAEPLDPPPSPVDPAGDPVVSREGEPPAVMPDDRRPEQPSAPSTRIAPDPGESPHPRPRSTDPAPSPEAPRASPSSDRFAAELEVIVRARRALGRHDYAAVRRLVRRHAQEFPDGSFVEEAQVLDLVAGCATDDPAARRVAAAYLEEPGRMFVPRVREACSPRDPP